MPTAKELNIRLEDRPSTLVKLCRALAYRGVNILAFQVSASERRTEVRLLVDNSATAQIVLDADRMAYKRQEASEQKEGRTIYSERRRG